MIQSVLAVKITELETEEEKNTGAVEDTTEK